MKLVLVRHGESLWNKKGTWTGLVDISLSEKGIQEAKKAAILVKDITFDAVFTSALKRSKETFEHMRTLISAPYTYTAHKALNERDYGDLTGKNKEKVKQQAGEKQYIAWRRSFDIPPPGGESLKDVYNRIVPYYKQTIKPLLMNGKNVLVVAHGNSLRALIKFIEHISDSDIPFIEIPTGGVIVYTINEHGSIVQKEIKT